MRSAILLLLLSMGLAVQAQEIVFDAKYVKVGIMSNEWPDCMRNNPNLRNLGTLKNTNLNTKTIGKNVLDILFQRDSEGLHMDRLYNEALQNTTVEEIEVALQDASAETRDILKREIAHQLLKNNYIVIFKPYYNKQKKLKGKQCTALSFKIAPNFQRYCYFIGNSWCLLSHVS